ncbi:hypothetical protein ACU6ZM_26155, partial [Klebsiella aerogenes]
QVVGNGGGIGHVGSPLCFNLRRFCRARHNNTIHCRCGKNGTKDLKTRLARERSQENLTHRLFFTYNYSPLFTLNKKISNTVS